MDTRFPWLLALVLSLASSVAYSSKSPRRNFDEVRRLFEQEFARDGRGGLTVGVLEQGELVWTHSIG